MKTTVFILLLPLLFFSAIFSQDDNTLLKINGNDISADEFIRMYRKNKSQDILPDQDINNYLDLFINFKLKVMEAENLKLDTSSVFMNELEGYVKQLLNPYLDDQESFYRLLLEVYDRMKKEVHASHIMLTLNEKASPEDTLKAYHKIMEIRERCIKGEDFSLMAREFSEDPSVNMNSGDLGWFGAFRMVYPFESTAYNTEPRKISMPVRSSFGYHIIKIHETRPSKPKLLVAHIFIRSPESMSAEESELAEKKIFSIYEELQQGTPFEQIAMSGSEDKSSGVIGGRLPWFSSGEMIPEFENAAFSLDKPGDYSKPVKSPYGWHIIKLIEKKELKSFDEEKPYIQQMFNATGRMYLKQQAYISKLKKEYDFTFFPENFEKIYPSIDSTIFLAKWKRNPSAIDNNIILSFGNKTFTIGDFANYLELNQKPLKPYSLSTFIDEQFKVFSESELLNYETEMLPVKHPELAYIIQEYHDGMLLFELSDKMIWSKAVTDTLGLEQFFKKNKNNYLWGRRAEAFIITGNKKDIIEKAGTLAAKNGRKKKFTEEYLKNQLCPDDTSENCITFISGKFEKGENPEIDSTEWISKNVRYFENNDENSLVFIKKILKPSGKNLNEARGQVIADYQVFLENEWLNSLKMAYQVEVNQELLEKIKQSDD